MKVKMLVNTNYNGFHEVGKEIVVPETVAKRWDKNRIAVIIAQAEERVEEVEEEIVEEETNDDSEDINTDEVDLEATINDEDSELDFEAMSTKELYKFCVEQGLDVEQKKTKKYYLDAIANL